MRTADELRALIGREILPSSTLGAALARIADEFDEQDARIERLERQLASPPSFPRAAA